MCNQKTINHKVSVIGTSIAGETDAKATFCPAPPDTGIVFVRNDLTGCPKVKCSFENANIEYRWTSLAHGDVRIEHTEHALAAISGLGLDNVLIELEQASLPVTTDYSSKEFTRALMGAGIVEQPSKKGRIKIHKPIIVYKHEGLGYMEYEKLLIALPYDGFKLTYVLDYPKLPQLTQVAEMDITPEAFVKELADARSYVIESELEEVVKLTGKVSSNVLVVKSGAEKMEWKWPNEPARHKALDLLGDLGLLGKKVLGHVIGFRSGHRLNLELCKKFMRSVIMIPLVKPMLGIEEKTLVNEVLSSGMLAQGEYVERFERDFASYLGSNYCVATSSGTSALHAALLSLGIKPGDKVITTPFSFIATANAILYVQAVPVFCDIDLQDYNISPQELLDTIKNHPDAKAIIIVHLYGYPARMAELMEIADKYNLAVIEDCAQAHGASINGRKVGTFGQFGVFSFYPTKNMTCGEGGMLTTSDKELADKARRLINHGQIAKYRHDVLGYNYRMTNIHAAIGIEQLRKLPGFNERRKAIAARYSREITNTAYTKPVCLPGFEHVYHQYTLGVNNRSNFIEFLETQGIGYGIHYPTAIPDQPLYQQGEILGSFTNARIASERVVSIPVHPGLTDQEVDYIVSSLQKYSRGQ